MTRRLLLALTFACSLLPSLAVADDDQKTVYFMAGTRSHGYGSHEHYAGCMLLANALREAMPDYKVVVYRDGWPKQENAFADADTLVMYCDGGGRHPANQHLEELRTLSDRGVGIVCIHYGVEVPKGEPGNTFLDLIGGYFETHWSVNPHWTAKFEKFNDHPINRGVKPFEINDEWYYHMRFREDMKGVTPILTAIPPASTLKRRDGAHSGNPHVRKKVGQPQHVAWASENEKGSRGFGFTGGHYHWNWAEDNFRRVVLNAIVWTAHDDVPKNGVGSDRPTLEELKENQDYQPPNNYDFNRIRQQFDLEGGATSPTPNPSAANVKPRFQSKVVTIKTPGRAIKVDVDLTGAKQLFLVVDDAGDGFSCDWADWGEPILIGPAGKKKLTELNWKSASTDWGQVRKNQNASGQALKIDGRPLKFGIGTHATSIIEFELPPGYERFQATAGLDDGGANQGACGENSSVRFAVYTERPRLASQTSNGVAGSQSREPAAAVAGLDVADGLEANLFASEPELLSLTNLDIDHRGRIWVCEVVNYRKHNGKRPEGDRILILEDTDGDGDADTKKVYYQGRDVDSAMGICVLGNKTIVSCSPNIIVFTDEDGDDRPDKKEILFSKTGQPQHDHSAHSFLFGPDGKLYWNVGNTGKAVHDADGKPIIDVAGNQVIDNGKPYYGGMPFRCNLDGSEFEVLGHNFRNNYEVTVDSYGGVWQSDNDDDGNRGVRINFVMEFGNYGYRDELTGAGWRVERTGMHEEIPLRHWHLRDPGVVPNLLQTGAGSPTGITVYEGRLLPKVFWDQVIHCDAGPNVVRAYPVKPDGAGYEARMENVLHGARDNWFRPADVCVAPDGSLFVTDWYDPGVGGHNMRDLERGRIFRVAPPGHKYKPPTFDFESIDGCIAALRNPAGSVRFMAWTKLNEWGTKAEPALRAMWRESDNPRHRARALWLLAKLPNGEQYIDEAIRDDNADLRMTGLRAARRFHYSLIERLAKLVRDPSPAVRRECAVALRHYDEKDVAQLWTMLAVQHDGEDRWYLEALGIAAGDRWDEMLTAYLAAKPEPWKSAAGRDIIWRSRGKQTPQLIAKILLEGADENRLARYFRAMDYHPKDLTQPVLLNVAFSGAGSNEQHRQLIMMESAKRLGGVDLSQDPARKKQLNEVLDGIKDVSQFILMVNMFSLKERYPQLLKIAQEKPATTEGVTAIRALLDKGQRSLIQSAIADDDLEAGVGTVTALSNAADGRAIGLLMPLVNNDRYDLQLRRLATRAVASTKNGGQRILELAKSGKLDESLKSAAAFPLSTSPDKGIRDEAAKLFPPPPTKDSRPLPPISALVKARGSAERGSKIFATTGQCAKCHVVGKEGKDVGPNLSEIGGKLSRQALYESILYPSAGVSHNYETYSLALDSGLLVKGVLVSKTDRQITIKDEEAITRTFDLDNVEEVVKSRISLMPADLQKVLTSQDLIDVVEYLTTLKKKQ